MMNLYLKNDDFSKGPSVINEWQSQWDSLSGEEKSNLKSRQGVRYSVLEDLDVINPSTMEPTPRCDFPLVLLHATLLYSTAAQVCYILICSPSLSSLSSSLSGTVLPSER